jgi:hypothetical protein
VYYLGLDIFVVSVILSPLLFFFVLIILECYTCAPIIHARADKHRGHRRREHGDQILFVADTNLWIRQNIAGRGLV